MGVEAYARDATGNKIKIFAIKFCNRRSALRLVMITNLRRLVTRLEGKN